MKVADTTEEVRGSVHTFLEGRGEMCVVKSLATCGRKTFSLFGDIIEARD